MHPDKKIFFEKFQREWLSPELVSSDTRPRGWELVSRGSLNVWGRDDGAQCVRASGGLQGWGTLAETPGFPPSTPSTSVCSLLRAELRVCS